MADWGVSVYLGAPDVPARLPGYLDAVAARGGREVFTSLHIPEVPLAGAVAQLSALTAEAGRRGMNVVADIAPGALSQLGARPEDLSVLRRMGLSGLRLDYGFGPEEIAAFTCNPEGLRIVLNASTADPAFLERVLSAGADLSRLEACHNYYPRPETGLSMASLVRSSAWFKAHGVPVAAFIAGGGEKRGPIGAGLPTLEEHRHAEAGRAAAELLGSGAVDRVLFGDPWATEAELTRVAEVVAAGGTLLRVRLVPGLDDFQREIVVRPHRNRPDAAALVIRCALSRSYAAQGPAVLPFNTVARPVGAVTIDNQGYLRYSGELQVALADLPADTRVNVVGHVVPEDLPLLRLIGPDAPFTLKPVP
ncbi:DUF871 domain-containing protein [Symbiobacterium thermophilum]|uniref:DUF871 domain-containing protein n=1 Tax=Symbiobacterium thermophilum TaxID=2734 RepID=A0A953LJ63_SYMTR|nr:MupG family TIM beta-alpha barrel fold protein [Symbiobacterium thermophilum]MBY6275467.1 DUF871 domain-containing protein [Symbiobacterium thermophilum]